MSIEVCRNRSGSMEEGAYTVTTAITSETTPEEFDALVAKTAGYALNHGGRCGWNALGCAAYKGNEGLVRHIIETRDPKLDVNLGDEIGRTPLLLATICTKKVQALAIASLLIDAGANVNLAVDRDESEIPKGATPVWFAAQSGHYPLTRLLLEKGAIIPDCLTVKGRKIVDSVQNDIVNDLANSP